MPRLFTTRRSNKNVVRPVWRQSAPNADKRVTKTMQMLCDVDVAAAIRNGYNTESTIMLDVDIPSLNKYEREIIARWFSKGKLNNYSLEVPTLEGFLIALRKDAAGDEEAANIRFQNKQEARLKACLEAKLIVNERRTIIRTVRADLPISVVSGPDYNPAIYAKCYVNTIHPDCWRLPYLTSEDEAAISQSAEYMQWMHELDAANKLLNDAAIKEAEETFLTKTLQEKEESARKEKSFTDVIEAKGTELQRIRLKRGLLNVEMEARALLLAECGTPTVPGCTLALSARRANELSREKETFSDREMALVIELEQIEGVTSVALRDYVVDDEGGEDIGTEVWVTFVRSGVQFRQDYLIDWEKNSKH